jgi:hypothetical protein
MKDLQTLQSEWSHLHGENDYSFLLGMWVDKVVKHNNCLLASLPPRPIPPSSANEVDDDEEDVEILDEEVLIGLDLKGETPKGDSFDCVNYMIEHSTDEVIRSNLWHLLATMAYDAASKDDKGNIHYMKSRELFHNISTKFDDIMANLPLKELIADVLLQPLKIREALGPQEVWENWPKHFLKNVAGTEP